MKKNYLPLILLAATLSATKLQAQTIAPNTTVISFAKAAVTAVVPAFYYNQNSAAKIKSASHWRGLKTAGIITTGVGVASFVAGLAMVANEAKDPYFDENNPTPTARTGALGILGSIPAVVGGVTMWVIGGTHLMKLKKMERVEYKVAPNAASVVYKF